MAGLNFSGMQQFDPHSDPSSLAIRWKDWLTRFTRCIIGFDIKDKARKRALLLYLAGPKVETIFATIPDTGGEDDYDKAAEKLTAYFAPKKNTLFERHVFRQAKQGPDETIDQFNTRLRHLGSTCEFTNLDEEIKTQLVEHCKSTRLRRKAFRDDSTLDELIKYARALEISNHHTNEVEKGNRDTETVYHTKRGRQSQERQSAKVCYNCGGGYPHFDDKPCAATGKACRSCKKIGHFEKMCRSKLKSRGPKTKPETDETDTTRIRALNSQVPPQRSTKHQSSSDSDSSENLFSVSKKQRDKQTPIAKLRVDGAKVEFLVDTGATVNILTAKDYEYICSVSKKRIPLHKTKTRIFAYGSTEPVPLQGKFTTLIESKHRVAAATLYVTKKTQGTSSILSYETSACLRLITLSVNKLSTQSSVSQTSCTTNKDNKEDIEASKRKTTSLKGRYPKVFEGIGCLKDYQQKLHINREVPAVAQTYRRVPFHLRKQLNEWLDEYLQKDIIEPVSQESTDWVSGLVVAPKPRNPSEVRVCGDYRQVNTAIQRERHPIPTVDELMENMSGAVKYSKVDLKAGYHQIPLEKKSRSITTFTTHRGLFRYKRLPFGINSASEVFQNAVENAIRGIAGVRNIADDIIIWGSTQEEHDIRLEQLFARLHEKGLTVNPSKCLFDQRELWFYGFLLTEEGIKADPRKVDAIKQTKAPKDAKALRSFLGLANYCSRFIQNFSTLTAPLRQLTATKVKYEWKPEHQNAFDAIKEEIQKDCIMHFYDPRQRTLLTVDASPTGLGAILSNVDSQGNTRNVAYASKSLTDVERRYSQTEREALAVVWGCERFHLYLIGTKFTISTDHKALEVIYNAKSKPPARIERWALRLQQYDFEIHHRKGEGNPADVLSRQPLPETTTCSNVANQYVNFVEKHAIPNTMTIETIISETQADQELQATMESIQSGNWNKYSKFYSVRQELTVTENNLLLRGTKLIMPQKLRVETLHLAHKGHQGIVKTKQALRTKVWWPRIDREAEDYVKHCHACQSFGHGDPPPPLRQHSMPTKPWERLHMDFCGPFPSGETLLVVIDSYSKFPEVEIMKSTTAAAVTKRLDRIFATHGLPLVIYSDNGPPFTGNEIASYMKERGITHHRVTPLWPQANGEAEAFMKPLGKAIKAARLEGKNWTVEMYDFLLA